VHLVAVLEVAAVGLAERNAGRRSRRDHVAGLERDRLADERDDLGDAEDHVRRRGVLHRLAVQPALNP
jgi:hypothetical protein